MSNNPATNMNPSVDTVQEAVSVMRLLADPTRLRLLGLLRGGEMNVTTLCSKLDLAQPTVSHHLGLLRSLALVCNRRDGKQVFYSLNPDSVTNCDESGGLTIAIGPVEVRFCASCNGPHAERAHLNGEKLAGCGDGI